MCIENELLWYLYYGNVIEDFTNENADEKPLTNV